MLHILQNQRTSELLDSSPQEQGGKKSGADLRQDRVIHISFGFGGILGCAKGRAQAACYSDSNNSLPGFP